MTSTSATSRAMSARTPDVCSSESRERDERVGGIARIGHGGPCPYRAVENAFSAKAMVVAMSSAECAADTNPASKADGAR